jgi:hypothetical protein
MLALVMFVSSAQAQIGDWQEVENLSSGDTIFVQAERHFAKCRFEYATDSTLFCEQVYRSPDVEPREVSFDRSEIRQVTLEYIREGSAAKGALIGLGAGATAGAVSLDHGDARARLGAAIIVGTIGGMFGSLFGRTSRTVHSKVIYQK